MSKSHTVVNVVRKDNAQGKTRIVRKSGIFSTDSELRMATLSPKELCIPKRNCKNRHAKPGVQKQIY